MSEAILWALGRKWSGPNACSRIAENLRKAVDAPKIALAMTADVVIRRRPVTGRGICAMDFPIDRR
jgi:hypothetical protein